MKVHDEEESSVMAGERLDLTNFMDLLASPLKSLIAMFTATFITLTGNSNFTV